MAVVDSGNYVTTSNVRYIGGDDPDGGVSLGKDSSSKVSLYGATPVVRPALTNYTISPATPTNISNAFGFTTSDQMNELSNLVNAIRQALVTLGAVTT